MDITRCVVERLNSLICPSLMLWYSGFNTIVILVSRQWLEDGCEAKLQQPGVVTCAVELVAKQKGMHLIDLPISFLIPRSILYNWPQASN